MGSETRHMHIFVFCRSHPNEQELAPLGGGVFTEIEEVEAVLDEMVETGARVFAERGEDTDGVEFRGPGILGIHTIQGSDERSKSFGGDGKCHRVFTQVWCIGDPDECSEAINGSANLKMLHDLPGLLQSDDPRIRALGQQAAMMMLGDILGNIRDEDEDEEEDIFRLPETRKPDHATSYASEPFDDFLDFEGFDEPTDKKRLN